MRRLLLLVLLLAALGLGALGALRTGPAPTAEIAPSLPGIGPRTAVTVTVREPQRGLSAVTVELVQDQQVWPLASETFTPRGPLDFWGPLVAERQFAVEVGKTANPGLRNGTAVVRVRAERARSWLRREPEVVVERELPVRLQPPSLQVLSTQTYVRQGGAEAVVYRVGEGTERDGVEAGSWFFPGFPLPGGQPGQRFALFAVPYDLGDPSGVRLLAADALGNETRAAFIDQFTPRPFTTDTITVSDTFLAKVVPEILANTPEVVDQGDPLATYLEINRNLRRANNEELRRLAAASEPRFLWQGAFGGLPNGKVMSSFADRRTYLYNGQEVDQQDHLGFDLASVQKAPIPASGAGVVVLARYFGIYGNAVVIDHGYGLQSLYGHLSTIEVSPGQRVERGQRLGTSGVTGLAAGDHLHFTMLLAGLPVNPVEWWDGQWIAHRLGRKLGAALPGSGVDTTAEGAAR
jgi:murein DD-endopeptidase MepM/ murein hydrolase activator NlpD